VGDVADRGEQGGVDHRGAGAKEDGGGGPGGERVGGGPRQRDALQEHSGDDEPFAAVTARQGPVASWPMPHKAGYSAASTARTNMVTTTSPAQSVTWIAR
jgi:hypothetical protein